MKTPVCEMLGIEFPLCAFSHCRDVVAAVTNAGGFGVFGAMRYGPEELETELRWIDEQVDGKPYGLDVIVPQSFVGKGEQLDASALASRISDDHWDFLERLLDEHGLAGTCDREAAIRSSRASTLFSDRSRRVAMTSLATARTQWSCPFAQSIRIVRPLILTDVGRADDIS